MLFNSINNDLSNSNLINYKSKYQKDPIINKKIQVMYPTSSNYRSSSRSKIIVSPSDFKKNSQSYVYVQKPNRSNFKEGNKYQNYLEQEDIKSPFQTNLRHSIARSYQSEHYSNQFDNFQSQIEQNLNKLSRKTTSYLPTSQIISHKLPTNQYPSFQKHKQHKFNIETLSNKSSSRIRQMNQKIDQTTKNILKNGMIRKSSHKKYEQFMTYDPRSSQSLHKRKSSHEQIQSSEKRKIDPKKHNELFIYSNQRQRSNEKPKIYPFSPAQRPNYGIEYSTNMMDTKLHNPNSYRPQKDSKFLSSNYESSQIVSPLPQYNLVDSVTRNINSFQYSTKSNPFMPSQLNFNQNYKLPSTNSKRKDITFNNINFKHSSTRQPNLRVRRQNDVTETNKDKQQFQFKLMQEQNGKNSYRKLKPTDFFITSPSNRYQDHKYQERPTDFGNNLNFNAFQSLKSPQFSTNYNFKHQHNPINFSTTHIPSKSSLNSKNIHFSGQQQINFKKSDSFQQDFDFLNENQPQNLLNLKKTYDFSSNNSANRNEQFEFKDFSDEENDPFQALNSYQNLQKKKLQPISMVPENRPQQKSQKNTNSLNQKSKQLSTNLSTQKQDSAIVSPLKMQEAIQHQVNSPQKPKMMKKYISHMTDKQSQLIAIVLIVLAFFILILQLVS